MIPVYRRFPPYLSVEDNNGLVRTFILINELFVRHKRGIDSRDIIDESIEGTIEKSGKVKRVPICGTFQFYKVRRISQKYVLMIQHMGRYSSRISYQSEKLSWHRQVWKSILRRLHPYRPLTQIIATRQHRLRCPREELTKIHSIQHHQRSIQETSIDQHI